MNQTRQGQRSTKNMAPLADPMDEMPQEPVNERTHELYMALEEVYRKLFSDQTGPFPQTSNQGRKYVVVFYVFDNNAIKLATIKNITQGELLRSYKEVYDYLKTKRYKPQLHNWTMRHRRRWNCSSKNSRQNINTLPPRCIEPTMQRRQYKHGKNILKLA